MTKSQSGFTLIELVVVITILGILAAIALPRFAALQTDARIAKMQGALGSVKAAAAMSHSAMLTGNLPGSGPVTLEGATINLVNGYPVANDIATAAGVGTDYGTVVIGGTSGSGSATATIPADANHANCNIVYTEAGANSQPQYSAANLTAANCS